MKTLQELFADRSRWGRYHCYMDASGEPVAKEDATCYCIYGGIDKVYSNNQTLEQEIIEKLKAICFRKYGHEQLSTLNDRLGYDAVMELIKEANV